MAEMLEKSSMENGIVEMKLYCPLKFQIDSDDDYNYLDEVDSANYIYNDDEINARIRAYLELDKGAVERGLAEYFRDENLKQKVLSAVPEVETRDGDIYGVITVKSYGELSNTETEVMIEDLTGQLADGFGEGFEQREIKLGGDKVFVAFWNSDNYFLKPETEVFPENKMDMTMGGLS